MAGKKPDKVVTAIAATLEAAKADAVPIEGGPVAIPLDRAAALWLIPWMCEPECRVGARLLPPKSRKQKALYATWGDTRYALDILREFTAALATVDTGTLELLSAASADVNASLAGDEIDDADGDEAVLADDAAALTARRHVAARFRMIGTVADGVWTVTHARPHVSAAQLESALEVLDMVEGTAPFALRDDEEARAVAELAAKSTSFIRTNPAQVRANELQVEGNSIIVADDRRPYLAMILLRHRLAIGPWDLEAHQRMDEKWLADYHVSLRLLNERAQVIQQRYHAPRIETLLETATATYYRTDFGNITFGVEDIAVTPLIHSRVSGVHYRDEVSWRDSIAKVDGAFTSMGYRHLGDYQHSRSDRREAYRVYGGTNDGTFALWGIVAGAFNMHWFFYSLLDDDFWVTTATSPLSDGALRPARSSYRAVGKITFADQADEHRRHVAEHASRGMPHASPARLTDFLPVIDRLNAEICR